MIQRTVQKIGSDYLITFSGGQAHIGTCVMAVPYQKNGENKATLSVLNVPSHKDDVVASTYAKKLCELSGQVVICCGGIHYDNISSKQMQEVLTDIQQDLKKLEEEYQSGMLD
jgi:hypothetical protein